MCVTVAKIGQGRPKSKDCGDSLMSTILPNTNVLGQVIAVLGAQTKSRSMRFDLFAKVKVNYMYFIILPCKTIPSCTTVAVIVSEIMAFNVFSLNVCQAQK